MKIGINARYLQNIHSGIENYTSNLILNLKKIDKDNHYVLFFGTGKPIPQYLLDADFDYDVSKLPTTNQILKILWSHLYLPREIVRRKVDLFYEPSFIAPIFKKCHTVITVYDLAYLRVPHCYKYRHRLYLKSLLSGSIRQARAVTTISENTKEDILNHFKVSPDKVRVVYPGRDSFFRRFDDKEEMERVKKIYNIRKNFILNVSLISPRKNLVTLIRAFKILSDRTRSECQLVIAGRAGWLCDKVFKEAASSGLRDRVVFCGHVPKEHLLCLYNAADMFAYPSLHEGFGLPVLEAMACGCPVIASKTSSLPEACGDAALLVDPESAEDLTAAIERVKNDRSLRQSMIERGLKQAERFSWRKAAEEMMSIYKTAGSHTRT